MRSAILLLIYLISFQFVNAQIIYKIDSIGIGDIQDITLDANNNIFFVNGLGNQLKKIDTSGAIAIIAGTGSAGYSGDNGPATLANLNQPTGIAIDSLGNIIFADIANHRVRKVNSTTGVITTIVGTGVGGYNGDGEQATTAQLNAPCGVRFDRHWNLYITDNLNYRIRKVNTTGIITTVAGTGTYGSNGDGFLATAANCSPADGIAIDSFGNIYFSQSMHNIRRIDTSGVISTIAGDTSSGIYNGDNILATSARLQPNLMEFGPDGLLYISDEGTNCRIRKIDNLGLIHTVAGYGGLGASGNDGPATAAELSNTAIYFDKCGNLLIGNIDFGACIRKVTFNPYCWSAEVPQVADNQLTIYPNPVLETLYIDNVKTNTKYALFNITGIMEQTGILNSGTNNISIKDLAPGMYLLKIWNPDGTEVVKRVVKM